MYFMFNNLLWKLNLFLTTDLISGMSLKTYPKPLTLRQGQRRAKMEMFFQLLGLIPATFYTQCVFFEKRWLLTWLFTTTINSISSSNSLKLHLLIFLATKGQQSNMKTNSLLSHNSHHHSCTYTTSLPPWTLTSMLSEPTYPQRMPYLPPFTQSSYTWWVRTATSGCCWLQFSIQHNLTHEADWETKHSGLEYNTLRLDIGLPYKQTPESLDWQSHFLFVNSQHRSHAGLCVQPPLVHWYANKHSKRILNNNENSYPEEIKKTCRLMHREQSTAECQQNQGADCWLHFLTFLVQFWQIIASTCQN